MPHPPRYSPRGSVRRTARRSSPATRLRVAIVAESFLPHVNGVTNSVLRVIEHLRAQGHEVLVIAPGPGEDFYLDVPIVRVPAVSMPTYAAVRIGLPIKRITSILRSFRPNIVHLAAPTVLGAAGARAARNLGIPSIAVFQADIAGFARRYRCGALTPMLWAWLRFVHGHAALTLAPSTSTVWTLRAHGLQRVVPWARGVDLERFAPDRRSDDLRRSLAPRGEVIVGFVGRLAKEKQVERLRALSDMDGVKLVIVGDGPERPRLEALMPGATFTGFLSGDELSRHHASFDVFVHSGLDETFCQAVQEALASGVPVVAPAAGGPMDLVQHGHNGYLWSPEQPEMLVGAVVELVRSPLLRHSMGNAARESVEHRPWSTVLAELEQLYVVTINGGARPRAMAA